MSYVVNIPSFLGQAQVALTPGQVKSVPNSYPEEHVPSFDT